MASRQRGPFVWEGRHQQAEVWQVAAAARSPQQQLALLDDRLGKGVGAVKERLRLLARLAKQAGDAQEAPTRPQERRGAKAAAPAPAA